MSEKLTITEVPMEAGRVDGFDPENPNLLRNWQCEIMYDEWYNDERLEPHEQPKFVTAQEYRKLLSLYRASSSREVVEVLDTASARFNRAADWLAGLVCTNGAAGAELVVYLKQCAAEARAALEKVK